MTSTPDTRRRTAPTAILALLAGTALGACAMSGAAEPGGDRASGDGMMAEAASMSVTVGGAPMLPSRDIVDNAVNSADHETLVAAVGEAGLVDTLKSAGPFTVFAPTDDAFADLPDGTVETLLRPENREQLQTVLTYHVVPGDLDMADLRDRAMANGGSVALETASGGMLTVATNGPANLVVEDARGNIAHVTTYDVRQSNGVIHVVDRVLLPM
ncbi:MAG: fasciclin domain-containing protein [Azospirillaceae bacterium]